MRPLTLVTVMVGLALGLPAASAPKKTSNLEIYWIDTEGGAATLIVSPTGRSLLFDTGHIPGDSKFNKNNKDVQRIFEATQKAGLKKIDVAVISHWHPDHVGGLPALAGMIPIDHFYDHGDAVEDEDRDGFEAYKRAAGVKRVIAKAGDKIPLPGTDVLVVSSETGLLKNPVKGGGPNPFCAGAPEMPAGGHEDQRMLGLLLTFGDFKYLSLGDFDWHREMELTCPINKIGPVNLWLVDRHGNLDAAGAPAFIQAIKPQVVIVNNGPRKGFGRSDDRVKPTETPGKTYAPYERNPYLRMAGLTSVEGIWQAHLALLDQDPAHNTTPDMIANLGEGDADQGYLIHGTVRPDGSFSITNERNGYSRTYQARRR